MIWHDFYVFAACEKYLPLMCYLCFTCFTKQVLT
ncbi:rCG35828 [Rattus norvegicus]|uniref:RCG35828 n=1 Tax=Rattus norvegicus TaxID=10116 RepID=A6IJI1_RAT|nr:rCG35828 [Rattus norvegicus]